MSDNAKLRRLRKLIDLFERSEEIQQGAANDARAEIDRMLAESEPAKPGAYVEPLPELVARLCGYVGPDGRGRP